MSTQQDDSDIGSDVDAWRQDFAKRVSSMNAIQPWRCACSEPPVESASFTTCRFRGRASSFEPVRRF